MINSSFRFNSILAIVISIAGFFIQSCGGTASENTPAEPRIPGIKKDQQVYPATAVVDTNDKKRFAFNEDKTRIRANQGHSVEVELDYQPTFPPQILYHGTASRFLPVRS